MRRRAQLPYPNPRSKQSSCRSKRAGMASREHTRALCAPRSKQHLMSAPGAQLGQKGTIVALTRYLELAGFFNTCQWQSPANWFEVFGSLTLLH